MNNPKYKVGDKITYRIKTPEVRKQNESVIREKGSYCQITVIVEMYKNPNTETWYYLGSSKDFWISEDEIIEFHELHD